MTPINAKPNVSQQHKVTSLSREETLRIEQQMKERNYSLNVRLRSSG